MIWVNIVVLNEDLPGGNQHVGGTGETNMFKRANTTGDERLYKIQSSNTEYRYNEHITIPLLFYCPLVAIHAKPWHAGVDI